MTDFPEMTIASDDVDKIFVEKPLRWNIDFIRKFMCVFGLINSIFDYLTFGILLFILNASQDQFRTAWFVESVMSATMIVLVVLTFKPFFKSMPSKYLLSSVVFITIAAAVLPFTSFGHFLGLIPLPYVQLQYMFLTCLWSYA